MTFGEQNTEKEAHQQLDYAIDQGVNFIDTAEMYPVPTSQQTATLTEKYIGTWLKNRTDRDQLVVATKIAGPSKNQTYIRGGSRFNAEHIAQAINDSLARLQTDYIDLYQLHWPERKTNFFGKLGYQHRDDDAWQENFLEVLQILQKHIISGKIRHIGISNETPWGTMRYLALAEKYNLPRMVSIQNPYNLLNRTFEVGLAEIAIREKIGLLAYSPMAFGLLSGKYFTGEKTSSYRITRYPQMARYNSRYTRDACLKYIQLSKDAGYTPAQMALAYVNTREFVTSNIIGATSMDQLKENISAIDVNLPEEVIKEIENIHLSQPNPAP
jgi:aryl-alcohol dehydrogenase-like predicted oxidoreductase